MFKANFRKICQVVRSIKGGENGHERENTEHGRSSVSVRFGSRLNGRVSHHITALSLPVSHTHRRFKVTQTFSSKHLKMQIFIGREALQKSKKCALQVTQVVFHSVFCGVLFCWYSTVYCCFEQGEWTSSTWKRTMNKNIVWNSQEKESWLAPVFYSLIAIQTLSNCLLSIHSSMAFVRKGPFCSFTQPSQDAYCMSAATGNKRHVKA